jgi:hypothetical protein
MTPIDDVQDLLDELLAIYNKVQQKHAYWENLQIIKLARIEYEMLTAQVRGKLKDLRSRKHDLELEKSKPIPDPELERDDFELPIDAGSMPMERRFLQWQSTQTKSVEFQGVVLNRQARLVERDQLKKQVNRWKYSWQLDSVVLGKINRIADDADRPLGEALMLLDWNVVFADRSRTQESLGMYLLRLTKWRASLVEYLGWLGRDIDDLEMSLRGWSQVGELWQARNVNAEGQELWMAFITEKIRAKQDEIAKLESEIDQYTKDIAQLRKQLRDKGEYP